MPEIVRKIKKITTRPNLHWPDTLTLFILIATGSLFPYLWLKGGYTIAGHDAGLPFDPIKHLTNRFYVWTERIGFGADQSHELGAVPIHALEALVQAIVQNVQIQQMVVFAFWLILPGVTMFWCMRSLFGQRRWFLILFASLFYMYNHFLLQAWWIFERTKFSLYAALPLVVVIFYNFFQRNAGIIPSSLYLSLLLFFLNGGGFVPLFGAIIITIITATAYFSFINFSKITVVRLAKFLGLTLALSIPLNAYWILPYLILLRESFDTGLSAIGGIKSVLEWANYISSEASVYNLLRLQGIIDWTANQRHPYASVFLQHPFFLGISYLLAPLAFVSVLLAKQKNDRLILLFFALLALTSMIFVGGTHQPFGFLFTFLMQNVPGFIVFRTPYYKFAPALWLSYAVLIGYTLGYVIDRLKTKGRPKFFLSILVGSLSLVILGIYNYPYFTGEFFDYLKGQRSTRIKVPPYIYDVDRYISKERELARILLLPRSSNELNADTYIWKYWSLAPVTSLLSNNFTVTNRNNDTEVEVKLVNDMYRAMDENNPVWKKLLFIFGVDTAILRKDYAVSEDSRVPGDLSKYENLLSDRSVFKPSQAVGMWQFYDVDKSLTLPTITALPDTIFIDGYFDQTPLLTYANFLSLYELNSITKKTAVINSEFLGSKQVDIQPNTVYPAPLCSRCTLRDNFESLDLPERVLPTSIFFPLVERKEKQALANETDWLKRERLQLEILKKRTFALREIRRMDIKDRDGFMKTETLLHQALQSLLESTRTPSYDSNLDTKRALEATEMLYIVKDEVIERLHKNIFKNERDLLSALLTTVDRALQELPKKAFSSQNEIEKNYRYVIKEPGTYDVLLNAKTLSNFQDSSSLNKLALTANDVNYPISFTNVGGDWYKLTNLTLMPGEHRITLADNTTRNIFSIPEEMQSTYKEATFSGNNFTFIASATENKCFVFPVTNLEVGGVYNIAFSYTIPTRDRRLIFKWDKEPLDYAKIVNEGHYLFSTNTKLAFEAREIVPTTTIYLHFCSEFFINVNTPKDATFTVSDISVKKFSSPKMMLQLQKRAPTDTPTVYYERINPTQYHIRVINNTGNPFMLSFAQRYNSQWKLYPLQTNWGFYRAKQVNPEFSTYKVEQQDQYFAYDFLKSFVSSPVAENRHMLINGYANGWWLAGSNPQDYLLLYDKQKRYYVGVIMTLAALAAVCGYLLIRFLKTIYAKKTS